MEGQGIYRLIYRFRLNSGRNHRLVINHVTPTVDRDDAIAISDYVTSYNVFGPEFIGGDVQGVQDIRRVKTVAKDFAIF